MIKLDNLTLYFPIENINPHLTLWQLYPDISFERGLDYIKALGLKKIHVIDYERPVQLKIRLEENINSIDTLVSIYATDPLTSVSKVYEVDDSMTTERILKFVERVIERHFIENVCSSVDAYTYHIKDEIRFNEFAGFNFKWEYDYIGCLWYIVTDVNQGRSEKVYYIDSDIALKNKKEIMWYDTVNKFMVHLYYITKEIAILNGTYEELRRDKD